MGSTENGWTKLRVLAALAGIALAASLFLPWYTYESPADFSFTTKGWKVMSAIDAAIFASGVLIFLAAVGRARGIGPAAATTFLLAAASIGLIVFRGLDRPYDKDYTVTPHVGWALALAAALAALASILAEPRARGWIVGVARKAASTGVTTCPSCGERVLASKPACPNCGHDLADGRG